MRHGKPGSRSCAKIMSINASDTKSSSIYLTFAKQMCQNHMCADESDRIGLKAGRFRVPISITHGILTF